MRADGVCRQFSVFLAGLVALATVIPAWALDKIVADTQSTASSGKNLTGKIAEKINEKINTTNKLLQDPAGQLLFRAKQQAPIQVDRKNQSLEDLICSTDIPYTFPTPVPLQGVKISGLSTKAIQTLGENYFVVKENSKAMKMSDIYKQNKNDGKANFVTVDCVIHPYLAFTNRVFADVIRKKLGPLTRQFLIALMYVAVADYNQATDADVKADIQANIAFFTVALKLLDPNFAIVELGSVPKLVQTDLQAILSGKKAHSAIMDREEDFSLYQPTGWYASSPELAGYYRAKVWLSRLSYPINDVDFSSGSSRANSFRRSVLLYRCLDLAEVDTKPAYETWVKIIKANFLFGAQVENWQEKVLYPHDYRTVFKTNSADLKVTLSQLAEPLYRTKLLLAVRKQKPVSLASTSIWDIDDEAQSATAKPLFRFMPMIGAPEEPWLRSLGPSYPANNGPGDLLIPAALVDLNAWGASQAGNLILSSSWALDQAVVAKSVGELKRWVCKRLPGGQVQPIESRFWGMMTPLMQIMPDGIQTVLRSEMWTTRRLESAFAAFVDSSNVIGPPIGVAPSRPVPVASSSKTVDVKHTNVSVVPSALPPPSVPASTQAAVAAAGKKKRAARGHYLDPSADVYARLAADATKLEKDLTFLGFGNQAHKQGFAEFIKLFERLQKISIEELNARPLSLADLGLLANIEVVLEKIDVPLPAVRSFPGNPGDPANPGAPSGGYNMALGRPGILYIILQNKTNKEWTLARGAVYTYFEIPGQPVTVEQVLARIDAGKMAPPYWVERCDTSVQESKKKQVAATPAAAASSEPL